MALRQRVLSFTSSVGGASSRPPSPTMSEATNASQINFGPAGPEKIITRADLRVSVQSYENLITTSAAYREALLHLSRATASFADAMETCAGLKGASYESGTRLQAAAGLHHLMSNQWCVLSDSLDKKFERPLRQHMENYKSLVADRSANYERAIRERSRIIRQTELEHMNVGRKKHRNLQTFREALAVLQRQVEELDELRIAHYQNIMEHEEEVWDFVQGKVSVVVRSTLDVVDRFTAKASDPILEPMLQSVPDPFDAYGKPEGEIFSILPPLGILSSNPSPSAAASPLRTTVEVDSTPAYAIGTSTIAWPQNNSYGSEWSDARSPSSSPPPTVSVASGSSLARSLSPPPRRLSEPSREGAAPAAGRGRPVGGGTRKSESKLRKVLSVISESFPPAPAPLPAPQAQTPPPLVRERSQDTIRGAERETNGVQVDDPGWAAQKATTITSSAHVPETQTDTGSSESTPD